MPKRHDFRRNWTRPRAAGSWIFAAIASGCIYPAGEPTGIELSWRFVETNTVDGEDTLQVRTCEGARVQEVMVAITDTDDSDRQGEFRFNCLDGYQTLTEFQTQASDAFVRLNPGPYQLQLHTVTSDDEEPLLLSDREIEVDSRDVTVESWVLSPPPINWTLDVIAVTEGDQASCTEVRLALYYAQPEVDLADFVSGEESMALLYREQLVSDRDLSLSGQATNCDGAVHGLHEIRDIDRGVYLLEVGADDRVCAIRVELGPGGTNTVIDLANLPCDG